MSPANNDQFIWIDKLLFTNLSDRAKLKEFKNDNY